MEMKWIWARNAGEENVRVCFLGEFVLDSGEEQASVQICASTRYILYINGEKIGQGPIRSGKKTGYLDCWDIGSACVKGLNYIQIRVWSYGWSTYQSLFAEGGVCYRVEAGGRLLAVSDEQVRCAKDKGHQSYAPKRNVNLGFTDYYDARCFDSSSLFSPETCSGWERARISHMPFENLEERPVLPFHMQEIFPKRLLHIQEVSKTALSVSINTRDAFFPGRQDADETIFLGYLGSVINCERDMKGMISFPNRSWNGLLGSFCIDGSLYRVTDRDRSVEVELTAGAHFFLMQLAGKFDDLYCHMEFAFPGALAFGDGGKHQFFTAGPYARLTSGTDGRARIYNDFEPEDGEKKGLFCLDTFEEFEKQAGNIVWVDEKYVFMDSYLLSMARTEKVVRELSVRVDNLGILWNNQQDTRISPPKQGDYKRLLLDFGDEYVGTFSFTLRAAAGTVLDIYCYENHYEDQPDYTIGLNNGVRYICREGWQTYACMARTGVRYALLTFRDQAQEVRIRRFSLEYAVYPMSGQAEFSCSDYELNRIWEMCSHTHQLCMEDTFTDCPAYEQAYWIGDAQLSSTINGCISGNYELMRHNLCFAVNALENTGLMNALTPTDWNTSIPLWAMNWCIAIRDYAALTNDTGIIAELYPHVKEMLTAYAALITEEGLFLISSWNLIDWADLDIRDNQGVVTGQQAALSYCYKIGEGFAERMKDAAGQRFFRECRDKLLRGIGENLWDSDRSCYYDGFTREEGYSKTASIQTHALLYLYDAISDPERRKQTAEYLIQPPDYFVKAGSPFMLYYVYECLDRIGEQGRILEDIRDKWLRMLSFDTTTCWEVFPGFYEEDRTRSYCHSWSASPVLFLQRLILGIRPLEEDFSGICVELPEAPITWCRGSMPTVRGTIFLWWNREEKRMKVRVPEGTEVELKVPDDWKVEMTETSED
ncbi:alpha-L-rhamnosidase C-terminal domain-containing protein [Diplocloster hominis]|uniref:alpha-L-rhamnosidase-related protein n=1 Tax=Diplocloster hominis TaxID=3079010 RepID=UPI0031BA46D1